MNKVPTGLTLKKNEKVLWYGKRSWKSLISLVILGIIFLIFIFGIFFLLGALLLRLSTEYTITNHRVHSRYGIIGRKSSQTSFDKITDTSFSQGIFGRILNYGDVRFNTAGSIGNEVVFAGVTNPKNLLSKLENISEDDEERKKKEERLDQIRDKYYTGEISEEQYETAKKRINEEL